MYDPERVAPLKAEVVAAGVTELTTADAVDKAMAQKTGTAAIFVNSVCGCTARTARPGFIESLKHPLRPKNLYTVFAGFDTDAVARAREYFVGYPPSSPSLAIFREGQLVHFFERHEIEGIDQASFTQMVESAFERYCGDKVDMAKPIFDPMAALEITPAELKRLMDSGKAPKLVDCREDEERKKADIPGSLFLTQELAEEMAGKWDPQTDIVIFCHHGQRSLMAVKYFKQYGLRNIRSLTGGIDAWSRNIDKSIPTYS